MPHLLLALILLLGSFANPASAATSAVAVTPPSISVLGGESREFAVRFFDALGQPAVGESVQFVNDACGTFSNGSPVISVRTDATGLATTTFTARSQGITCWVTAAAGVLVRWDVLTFTLPLVHFETRLTPPEPRPGETYVVTVTPMAGAYRLFEADVVVRIVEGTASAAVSPSAANSGQAGTVAFTMTPDHRVGDYEIELRYRARSQRLAMSAPDAPWQDMWWGGAAESGWGVSVVQHRDMLFSVIYAYDASGRPTWYVMPSGTWNAAHTAFAGPLFSPRGSPFDDYDAASFVVGKPVGSATMNFVDGGHVAIDYDIGGVTGRKNVTRQSFAPVETSLASDWSDMWWGGLARNGWGIAVLQHYRTLFAIWFTYDAAGAPTWFVMPSGFWSDASTYEGRIYRATGSSWLGRAYDAGAFRTADVGSFRMRFSADSASFDYTIEGRSGTMALSRQPF